MRGLEPSMAPEVIAAKNRIDRNVKVLYRRRYSSARFRAWTAKSSGEDVGPRSNVHLVQGVVLQFCLMRADEKGEIDRRIRGFAGSHPIKKTMDTMGLQ